MVSVSGLVVVTTALLVVALLAVARDGGPEEFLPDGGLVGESAVLSAAEKPSNAVVRWLTTVDHADIGLLYIAFGTLAALWGGTDAMMLRTELLAPGETAWDVDTYNALFTEHGLTMLFFFVTPVFTGLGNYFLPPLLDADDMAFPRVNAIAFWLLPPGFLLVRGGLITEVLGKMLAAVGLRVSLLFSLEPVTMGWTMYVPMSAQLANPQIDLVLLGLHLSGVATTLAAINFVVTVFVERGEDVTWANLDIFSWTILTTSGLVVFAFPVLGSALVMLLLDRNFGTTFFTVGGGDPILWQHLFWFFGHPEVYILVLPAFGLVSLILPKFAGRELFGFKYIVYSTLAIGVLSFGVWAHHMFATGMDPRLRSAFMFVTVAIAVPSAVKVFNWLTTLWDGRIRLTAPMVCCLGAVATFIVGGVTGVFLAAIPVDLLVHGTYYVVGHFHLILVGIIVLSMFAASYYWFPIVTGRMYDRRLGRVQAGLAVLGAFVTFFPLLVQGMLGLPRRSATYPEAFALSHRVATLGAYVLGISVVLWVVNVVQSARKGPVVDDPDPWDLREFGQYTREWQWFADRLEERERDGERADD